VVARPVVVPNALGMHARAAARFARRATTFASAIRVSRGGVGMDGKSIMGLLLLAAPRGSEITISAEGPDEQAAVDALAALVEEGFGEASSH
jgi:phosphocarrier protein HPr